jgi:hypothetical protein
MTDVVFPPVAALSAQLVELACRRRCEDVLFEWKNAVYIDKRVNRYYYFT